MCLVPLTDHLIRSFFFLYQLSQTLWGVKTDSELISLHLIKLIRLKTQTVKAEQLITARLVSHFYQPRFISLRSWSSITTMQTQTRCVNLPVSHSPTPTDQSLTCEYWVTSHLLLIIKREHGVGHSGQPSIFHDCNSKWLSPPANIVNKRATVKVCSMALFHFSSLRLQMLTTYVNWCLLNCKTSPGWSHLPALLLSHVQ